MAVSSGCTTTSDCVATTRPGADTTLSIGIRPAAAVKQTNMAARIQTKPRAGPWTRDSISAALGEWNSSRAGIWLVCCRVRRVVPVVTLMGATLTLDGRAISWDGQSPWAATGASNAARAPTGSR